MKRREEFENSNMKKLNKKNVKRIDSSDPKKCKAHSQGRKRKINPNSLQLPGMPQTTIHSPTNRWKTGNENKSFQNLGRNNSHALPKDNATYHLDHLLLSLCPEAK